MKFNYKKVGSVIASAVMLSSTIGLAAAASYPEPFVASGAENAALVVGANAAVSDWAAAIDVQTKLNALVTSGGGDSTVSGTAWQVKTSSDALEIGESIYAVEKYIDINNLPLLAGGTLSNEKGDAKYEQFLYFDFGNNGSSISYEEDDDENVGLFYKVPSGNQIARYVMDFTTNLESDITANTLDDIEEEELTILSKSYVITNAVNASTGVQLTLIGGNTKVTISNGEEVVVDGKAISVLVSSTTQAQFTIDGTTTSKLSEGATTKLDDGTYIGVTDITYQNFAGGLMQATAYLGADKLELNNGSDMSVNGETISDADVTIESSISNADVSISEISINMTAEDDLYVPIDGKLSEATDLDEPEVMVSQNWDIEFKGLEAEEYEVIEMKTTASDSRYIIKFQNYNGDEIELPVAFANSSGVYPGEKQGKFLCFNITGGVSGLYDKHNGTITKDDYFVLNTASPSSASNDARTFVLQYKGTDKTTDTGAKMKFKILGYEDRREITLSATGSADLKLGGSTFTFDNQTSGASDDFGIALTGTDNSVTWVLNGSATLSLRTKNNALISIEDMNIGNGTLSDNNDWNVNITLDDSDRDGDYYSLATARPLFNVALKNDSDGNIETTVSGGNSASWVTDPLDSDKATYIDGFGVEIEKIDTSAAPAQFIVKIPKSNVKPLLYVSSGDIVVTPGSTGGAGGQVAIVKDSEVSSVSGKNLFVVGGSCINEVAAKILGSESPICGADFTDKTGVEVGQYIIKTVASPYDADKIAMLVAGYDAADTTSAVNKAAEGVSSDVDTSQVYPIVAA